jgi:hypothetical protein
MLVIARRYLGSLQQHYLQILEQELAEYLTLLESVSKVRRGNPQRSSADLYNASMWWVSVA